MASPRATRVLPSVKVKIKNVNTKVDGFLENKKNANQLVDVIAACEDEETKVILAAIRGLLKAFSNLVSNGDLQMDTALDKEDKGDLSAAERLKVWLVERYTDSKQKLVQLLHHSTEAVQELSLSTLMKLVAAEGQHPLRKVARRHLCFPASFFETIIRRLLSDSVNLTPLLGRFQEYLEYDDVRYFSMKVALKDMQERAETSITDRYLTNLHALIDNLSMPPTPDDGRLTNFISKPPETEASLKMNTHKEHKKLFTSLWLEFLRKKLPTSLYKSVLLNMHEKVMPFMTNPLYLSDFLTESYNMGGAISLLALNGLFILIQKYNLEYPGFYQKLYSLFEPSVFHVKYRARFFFLADLFLTSSHIPAYMVAAFTKRLSRLSLTAPPDSLKIVLPFIYNLLARHPSLKGLLHRPDGPKDLKSDPYKYEEPDMNSCHAMDSSLWEVKTLQSHYYSGVSTEAKKIDKGAPTQECELDDLLETTTDSLFEEEGKKKIKKVATVFQEPQGLFSSTDGKFGQLWTVATS